MAYNFKKLFGKRTVTFLLLLSLTSSALYHPTFVPRTQAIFGIGDIVIDVKALIRSVVDGIAMKLAQRMVDDMVKSTITWANEGFEGNPAFVQDPEEYFTNIADGVVGEYIQGSDLGFLCSPFQAQIVISLRNSYDTTSKPFQCTLTEIEGNVDNFYNSFQGGGGWESWFKLTQEDSNNPYGAYLAASGKLDQLLQERLKTEENKLNWGQGFRGKGDCIALNPDQATLDEIALFELSGGDPSTRYPLHDLSKPAGECLKYGPDKTPGSTIKSQLDRVLPSGLEKLITVNHVEQLVGAFANGLLNRYVFGPKGLIGDDHDDHFDTSNDPEDINVDDRVIQDDLDDTIDHRTPKTAPPEEDEEEEEEEGPGNDPPPEL